MDKGERDRNMSSDDKQHQEAGQYVGACKSEGLGACPMCGLADKVHVYPLNKSFVVKCDGCQLTTGTYHHPDFAASMWNSLLARSHVATPAERTFTHDTCDNCNPSHRCWDDERSPCQKEARERNAQRSSTVPLDERRRLANQTAHRYFNALGTYRGTDAKEQCRLAIMDALEKALAPSATLTPELGGVATDEMAYVDRQIDSMWFALRQVDGKPADKAWAAEWAKHTRNAYLRMARRLDAALKALVATDGSAEPK